MSNNITEDVIKKIRISNDIVDIIGKYVPLTKRGKNYFGVCPFHDDHSPSMSVSSDKQIYKCFSCGATGNVITFIMDYEKISFVEALTMLGKNVGIHIENNAKEKDDKYKEYYEIYDTVVSYYKNNLSSSQGKKAREYLNSRNINEDIVKEFDIGLSLDNNLSSSLIKSYDKNKLLEIDVCKDINGRIVDTFKNRIMFPIKNNDGKFVGFSGRIFDSSSESKYVNTKETMIFKKGSILYNLFNAREYIRREREIMICEGQMDAIRISSIGIKNVVALMGTSFTKEQLDIVKKLNAKVILNLDQDDAGKMGTVSIGDLLTQNGIETSVIVFEKYKDSDELITKEGPDLFKRYYDNKISFLDFKLNYLKKEKNLNDSLELSKYINEAIENINKLDDEILKEVKIVALAKEFNLNEEILRSKINKTNNKVKEFKEKVVVKKRILNKYDVSEIRIIYLMINNPEVIKIYEKKLGYLASERMTNLANEIVNYKYKNKGFDYADFITHVREKEELSEALKEVMNYAHNEGYTEEELEDYINIIKDSCIKEEINKLTNKMKNTLDIEEKKRIGRKIEEIKKEVLKW